MTDLKTFSWPARIYYEDTDASGVVYHANYLRYFERCRTEWLRAVGFSQERLKNELAVAFTIADLHVKYLIPARLDDQIQIQLSIAHVGRASLRFEQTISRLADDQILATGQFRAACVDMRGFRPCAVPAEVLKEIQRAC
ncbi:MAG: tol-pal system-associated acyl-CoA thioesterase [Nevskiales bacterium]